MIIKKVFCSILIVSLFSLESYSQDTTSSPPAPYQYRYLPEVGFGTGLMSFIGDVGYRNITQPIKYRMGYNLFIQKSVTPFLDASVFFLGGRLYGNERDTSFSYNFQSTTYSGGLGVVYNFNNIPFYSKRTKPPFISPYISAGFELISYDSKSDLKDINSKTYYYWKDGSIRDLYEYDAFANSSVVLQRDYTYETSIVKRSITVGIPIGGGINFRISNRMSMNLGTTLHLTLSDQIDNLKAGGSDKFLFSSASLRYNFGVPSYASERDAPYKDVNFAAIDQDDSDADGVPDLKDLCPNTPEGEKVDMNGCPPDDDGDAIPNYKDKEPNSTKGALVDEYGVEITEEYLARKIAEQDSLRSLESVKNITYSPDDGTGTSGTSALLPDSMNEQGITFKIQLGSFQKDGMPAELIEKFMTISDISSKTDNNGLSIYTTGSYGSKLAAESRKQELLKSGIKEAFIVAFDKSGNSVDLKTIVENHGTTIGKSTYTPPDDSKSPFSTSSSYNIEFKVQLAAFSKKVAHSVFAGIDNVSEEPAANGLTRYIAGSFDSYQKAAAYKDVVRKKGFDGAFVVAYKNAKRVVISSGDKAENVTPTETHINSTPVKTSQEKTSSGITFKVQIGLFKNEIPSNLKTIFSTLNGIEQAKNENGLMRYTSGSFSNYNDAKKYKEDLTIKGIKDAFVVAYKDNNIISMKAALQLIK